MSLKFYEAVKTILSDIESFLTDTLKSTSLSKSVTGEKDELLKKLKTLRTEFPQLNVEAREKTPDSVKPSEREAKVESQEIYDAIGDDAPSSSESVKPASSCSDVSEVAIALSATDLSASASMSGNLVRKNVGKSKMDIKSLLFSVFGKKYCLVSGGVFFMYDKMTSKKANGSFTLKGYEARVLAEQPSKKEFCFEVVCPGQKSYVFAAATQEEMDKWVSVVNAEALKVPDARLSVFCNAQSEQGDDDDLEYEDPGPVKNKGPKKALPSATEDEEFYDDVAPNLSKPPSNIGKKPVVVDDEIYDEAESKVEPVQEATEEDDLLYEDYDDVQGALNPPSALPDKNAAKKGDKSDETQYEKMYYGKWDCKADADNELAFKRGDIVLIVSQEYEKFGWWVGSFKGVVGLVPREYMTPAYELISG